MNCNNTWVSLFDTGKTCNSLPESSGLDSFSLVLYWFWFNRSALVGFLTCMTRDSEVCSACEYGFWRCTSHKLQSCYPSLQETDTASWVLPSMFVWVPSL